MPPARGTDEQNLFCHNLARGLSVLHLFNATLALQGPVRTARFRHVHTHTRQAEIRKRGRNWQPTDGRLPTQSSRSNAERKQDELLVNTDLC